MRILVLLPCNKGAKEGDYSKGRYWRVLIKNLEEYGIRKYVTIGAIDCIPLHHNLGDCVVLEDEMWRVKGYESRPEYHPDLIPKMAECILRGIQRISGQFDKIYILVNVKLYYEATKHMLEKIKDDKIVLVEIADMKPGKFCRKIKELAGWLAKNIKEHDNINIEKKQYR